MGKIYNIEECCDLTSLLKKGHEWICLKVGDGPHQVVTGLNDDQLYQITISKQYDFWYNRVMDFIGYIESSDINGIVIIDHDDLVYARSMYQSQYNGPLRDYEPKLLIHSTLKSSWQSIVQEGQLKSWKTLKEEGVQMEIDPIGQLLGDPDEFKNYVMLGSGIASEIVVASKQKNTLACDENAVYEPGVRLYLDAHSLALDQKLLRDGAHIKVKDAFVLKDYLVQVVTTEDFIDQMEWTPKLFSEKSDELVKENTHGTVLARQKNQLKST